ncbi:hypothetical protein ABZU32_28935 [Sphaerisporangium sp. NPDC005288]
MSRRILLNMRDHLMTLERAFSGPVMLVYGHMPLSRVVAESAAQICHLL